MRIASVAARRVAVPLTRPYAISGHAWDSVELVLFEVLSDNGLRGHGQAAPAPEVTGETCEHALAELLPTASGWLVGSDARDERLAARAFERCRGPAARAAIDMALCDLVARAEGVPVVERTGRVHHELPTSITIGQKPLGETLAEAAEYLARGFTRLKVKVGADVDLDLERLRELRRHHGTAIGICADANQGYDEGALTRFLAGSTELDLELVEQPLPRGGEPFLRTLAPHAQRLLCADESVLDADDLARLLAAGFPYGSVNVKLQKCGGPRAALRLARLCEVHGIPVMWGCNDESVLGIAAALHVAFATRATRWLDLDGSLDLAADPFAGGFALAGGRMRTLAEPGYGTRPVETR